MSLPKLIDKKPLPVDISHHYSRVTKNRDISSVKEFYKYFTIPGIGNLAGGMPVFLIYPITRKDNNDASRSSQQ